MLLDEMATTSTDALGETEAGDWQTMARRTVEAAAITCSRSGAETPLRAGLTW